VLRFDIAKDTQLSTILLPCNNEGLYHNNYSCRDDILLWKERVVIPKKNSLISIILQEYHDGVLGGHSGIAKTLDKISSKFYWPHMRSQIREYVLSCTICQQAKTETKLPVGLLHPFPIPA